MRRHRVVLIPDKRREPGICRWCDGEIQRPDGTRNRRRRWHEECIEEYKIQAWPDAAFAFLCKKQEGKCANCRAEIANRNGYRRRSGKVQSCVDHIIPLIDGGSHGRDNLQLLCEECHKTKTAREARARANRRNGRDKQLSLHSIETGEVHEQAA